MPDDASEDELADRAVPDEVLGGDPPTTRFDRERTPRALQHP
jgi:hypothetical protein